MNPLVKLTHNDAYLLEPVDISVASNKQRMAIKNEAHEDLFLNLYNRQTYRKR